MPKAPTEGTAAGAFTGPAATPTASSPSAGGGAAAGGGGGSPPPSRSPPLSYKQREEKARRRAEQPRATRKRREIAAAAAAAAARRALAEGRPMPTEGARALADRVAVALRAHITEKFRVEFKKGVDSYIGGQWGKARAHLEKCVKLNPHVGGDGPSQTLLGFMGGHGFQAPVDWPGYRALTSK